MTKEQMKQKVIEIIDAHEEELIEIGRALYAMPETGYREVKSAAYAKGILEKLGLTVQEKIAITGLRADAKGRKSRRRVAIMGELDSLILPSHAHADPVTGAAHACGHHTQIVMMLGAAMALMESGVMNELDGDVSFLAVPAEEVVEINYRRQLVEEGKLTYLGGKQEFIHLGVFDDIDAVIGGHVCNTGDVGKFRYGASYNGVVNKEIRFTGKSSHGGLTPELGVNALHAAVNAINNINSLRSALPETHHPRIHYIITKGGDSCNIIPDDVRMEMGVRADTSEYMMELNNMVNRAIRAGAEVIGAEVEITDLGAYMPTRTNRKGCHLFGKNAAQLVGEENIEDVFGYHKGSSTDVGDVACLKPFIYVNFGGGEGVHHTATSDIRDERFAYTMAAKAAAMTVIDLLADDADELEKITEEFVPDFESSAAYEEYCNQLFGTK